jgi:hypothetical protein
MVRKHFLFYGLRHRLGAWRYRIGAWRFRRSQLPADPPHVDQFGATETATLPPADATNPVDPVGEQTYWVMERRGHWVVLNDDVEIATLPSRTTALTVAVLRAHEDQPSEVVILGRDGSIEEKCEFG